VLFFALQGTLPLPLVALILGRDALLIVGSFAVRARALGWRWPGAAEFFRLGGTGHAEVRSLESLSCSVEIRL
jgi:cardiolipin synthase